MYLKKSKGTTLHVASVFKKLVFTFFWSEKSTLLLPLPKSNTNTIIIYMGPLGIMEFLLNDCTLAVL